MKSIVSLIVDHLRIYPEERAVESTVNKVKGSRAGALVFTDFLPASEGQEPTNVLQLSGKQLSNLASLHGNAIRTSGREAWLDLSTYVGCQSATATITCEEHQAGDPYIDSEGKEQKYTKTTTHYTVNSIAIDKSITAQVVNLTIQKNLMFGKTDSALVTLLKNAGVPVPQGVN